MMVNDKKTKLFRINPHVSEEDLIIEERKY
jgi:hypothetical protein